jgi:hypothetical protein
MSSIEVYDVVEQRLKALWTATPLVFENEDWPTPATPAPFVFVEVYGDMFGQASIGEEEPADNVWREQGQLLMHVLVPSGTGTRLARQHAKALAVLFRGQDIGGVTFGDASLGGTEPGTQDGQYYRMTCSVAWDRDE